MSHGRWGLSPACYGKTRYGQKVQPSQNFKFRECSVAKVSDWIWTESPAERTRSFLICHASVALWVARTCAIWSLYIEMESEPGASSSILKWRQELHFRSYIRQSCQYFSVLFWRFASGERNIKILRLCRRNHSESKDSELNLRPPDCNRTLP